MQINFLLFLFHALLFQVLLVLLFVQFGIGRGQIEDSGINGAYLACRLLIHLIKEGDIHLIKEGDILYLACRVLIHLINLVFFSISEKVVIASSNSSPNSFLFLVCAMSAGDPDPTEAALSIVFE